MNLLDTDPVTNDEQLVCEALVREIGKAKRWTAVVEAWKALLKVRHMADELKSERRTLGPCTAEQMPQAKNRA